MRQIISRKYTFEAAHQLEFLAEDHPCRRMHGHSYTVEVRVEGEVENDMVRGLEFEKIDVVMENLLRVSQNALDHRVLNEVIPNPSVENISRWFAEMVHRVLGVPVTVRVYEGPISWAQASVE